MGLARRQSGDSAGVFLFGTRLTGGVATPGDPRQAWTRIRLGYCPFLVPALVVGLVRVVWLAHSGYNRDSRVSGGRGDDCSD